jgi:hypothetical protein
MSKETSSLKQFDKPLLAALIGSIAAVAKALTTLLGKALGLGTWDLIRLSATIITHNQIKGFGVIILGWLILLIIGAIIGTILYYSLYLLGKDYLLFKSIGIGILVWIFDTTMAFIFGTPISVYRNLSNYVIFFASAIVYGITVWYLFERFIFIHDSKINWK